MGIKFYMAEKFRRLKNYMEKRKIIKRMVLINRKFTNVAYKNLSENKKRELKELFISLEIEKITACTKIACLSNILFSLTPQGIEFIKLGFSNNESIFIGLLKTLLLVITEGISFYAICGSTKAFDLYAIKKEMEDENFASNWLRYINDKRRAFAFISNFSTEERKKAELVYKVLTWNGKMKNIFLSHAVIYDMMENKNVDKYYSLLANLIISIAETDIYFKHFLNSCADAELN